MKTRLSIDGMRSVHAVRAIQTALTPVDGILRLQISMGEAVIEHDGRTTCRELSDAIAAAGFIVTRCTEDTRALPTLG